ncbi:encapsidation protein 52K [Goose adenovirus 4]|uniref:Encapsidation protein 52K n=1 Tax=Goose adenovirus 4 TaxID=1193422 RepID=I3PMM8_9ADEN|nr:encapsidation protein 52K [Goose adenovirus 4]AFC40568.1 encapsidation protein 52K [Goose adenovirus 4]
MHPVLQSVQNTATSGTVPRRRPPSPPRYPAQRATQGTDPEYVTSSPSTTVPSASVSGAGHLAEGVQTSHASDGLAPTCGIASGSGIDEFRSYERDVHRAAQVPESNLFKDPRSVIPQNDYEREAMYRSGQAIDVNRQRVLTPSDFEGDPRFNPAVNHLKAAELKRQAEQTSFNEEFRNVSHQAKLRTALTRRELKAGIFYLYDFVQTYMDHPDGRVALNPQLVLVAQHAGNSILAQRLWAIAEDRNAWLRELIEMAYMIVNDPYLSVQQQLSAICTTVVELSMKYAKMVAKNGYPSMPQMAKTQEFFYRVMEAILNLSVEIGVYNNKPVQYRQRRMSEIPQMSDSDYMFGLTQALESRPPLSEFDDFDEQEAEEYDYEDDDGY